VTILYILVGTLVLLSACSPPAPEGEVVNGGGLAQAEGDVHEPKAFRIINGDIVVDTFDVRYDLRDRKITLTLLSDLGDAATVMVSVSRGYRERGSTERYSVNYFSERSTIGAWREPRVINLDHDAWKRELEQRQRLLAIAGEPFTVSRVDDDIEISFVVPVNQDPPFQESNANLTGAEVTQSGTLRIVERRMSAAYPIDATDVGQSRFADPLNLVSQSTYRLSREVPLMPQFDPADPLEALGAVQHLRAGAEFTVAEVRARAGTPWYRVRSAAGEGWINSVALIGQDLVVVR
jgi:hypothetical protein